VFASDVYSVGVTIYQMLTGELPYATPAPADIERLMRGELVTPPRMKNRKIPKSINDIVLKALAPDPTHRYQRAADLLEDVMACAPGRRRPRSSAAQPEANVADIQSRLRAREALPHPTFCWHCRKPLQARTARCPFCGETQS
jgi:serine/threonine protein kinase